MNPQSISVIGAGGWGSALAQLLSGHGLPVTIWGHDPAQVEEINKSHTNRQFLPGVTLHSGITATADMTLAARGDLIVVVPPARAPSHRRLKTLVRPLKTQGRRAEQTTKCATCVL